MKNIELQRMLAGHPDDLEVLVWDMDWESTPGPDGQFRLTGKYTPVSVLTENIKDRTLTLE